MGIFIIYPNRMGSITCDIAGETINQLYVVLPETMDWKEGEREQILYGEGELGTARRILRSTVVATFQMLVFGTTQANIITNANVIKQAITNIYGGYIGYRPTGLSDSTLITYYQYLASPPPAVVRKSSAFINAIMAKWGIQNDENTQFGAVLLEVSLTIKAWAISTPWTPIEAKASSTIFNHDDAGTGHNNYVDLLSTNIKGDGLIPLIWVIPQATAYEIPPDHMLLHHRSMRVSANTNLDVVEMEAMTVLTGAWANAGAAGASDANYRRSSSASTSLALPSGTAGMDITYFGKLAVLLNNFYCEAGTSYRVRAAVLSAGGSVVYSNWLTIPSRVGAGTEQYFLHGFNELDWPPAPALGPWVTETNWGSYLLSSLVLFFERLSGAGFVYGDWIQLAKADEFIAVFNNPTDKLDDTEKLIVDVMSEYVISESAGSMLTPWDKIGSRLADLVLLKRMDHRLRFIFWDEALDSYDARSTYDITLKGYWCTIYPFGET